MESLVFHISVSNYKQQSLNDRTTTNCILSCTFTTSDELSHDRLLNPGIKFNFCKIAELNSQQCSSLYSEKKNSKVIEITDVHDISAEYSNIFFLEIYAEHLEQNSPLIIGFCLANYQLLKTCTFQRVEITAHF